MARKRPINRFEHLIDAATGVFIAQGYRRTQMADVADALGVAKGTLYLYVAGKEALFDLVIRHADGPRPIPTPEKLPLPNPAPGATLHAVSERLARGQELSALANALGRARVPDVRAELEDVLRELYDVLHANRTGIKLVDRCAPDHPELAQVWFGAGREGLLALLSEYLRMRVKTAHLREAPEPTVAARTVIETIAFWAVHRHWDPAPQPVAEDVARETTVHLLLAALAPDGEGNPSTRRPRPNPKPETGGSQ